MINIEYNVETGETTHKEVDSFLLEDDNIGVPKEISPRQFRLALVLKGYNLLQVETILESLEEPQKSLAKISWEYATSFEREFSEVIQFAEMMGISNEEMDDIFILGNTL